MQNIELKVRHPDLDRARAQAAALGARRVWSRHQRDSYFAVRGARLKVREMPGRAELIWYQRPDGARPRASTYHIVPLRDAAAARALLARAWGTAGVVEKARELWLWRNVRLHLDRVAGLGTFVELEGVVRPDAPETVTRDRVAHVSRVMGLGGCTAVPHSYRDLAPS